LKAPAFQQIVASAIASRKSLNAMTSRAGMKAMGYASIVRCVVAGS
jgi:hypothetical protein